MSNTIHRRFIAVGCAVSLLAAWSTAVLATDAKEVLSAITAFNTRYLKAINDGDIAALSALTSEDHIMIAPNKPAIIGKAANDAANGAAFQHFKFEERWVPLETVVNADLAFQRGTFTVVSHPKSGGPARNTHGNFLRIYRRHSDGSWWITHDMYSSDQPAAAN
jgi:ketosteroid isomerase-like protein